MLGFFDDVFARLPVPSLVQPLRRTVVEKIEHRPMSEVTRVQHR